MVRKGVGQHMDRVSDFGCVGRGRSWRRPPRLNGVVKDGHEALRGEPTADGRELELRAGEALGEGGQRGAHGSDECVAVG